MAPTADDASPARVSGLATWRISRLNQRAHRLLSGALAARGFNGYQYRLLAMLAEGGPMSQIELGRRAGIDRSDVTIGIDALGQRALVERSPDPADRRRNIVKLTEAGASSLQALDGVVAKVQDDLLADLSEEDRCQFNRLLDLLLKSVE